MAIGKQKKKNGIAVKIRRVSGEKFNTVVYVGGVFDLFHIGHLRLLKGAKKQGRLLVVGLLTDRAAERWKRKPIISFEQRREIVSEFADVILIQDDVDETKYGFIDSFDPDIIVHGDDKKPFSWEWARKNKKKVEMLPYTKEVSTTKIIEKICQSQKNGGKTRK